MRHLAGQVAELLHQLAERPAQGLLHPAVGLTLMAAIARPLLGTLLGPVEQAALARDQILHHADLLLTTLALFGALLGGFLRCLGVRGLAVLQLVQYFLQLGQLLPGIVHPPVLGRVPCCFRHPLQVAGIHPQRLRVNPFVGAIAPGLLQQRLETVLDGFLQFLQLPVEIGKVGRVWFQGGTVQGIPRGLAGVLQRAGGAVHLTVLQLDREPPHPSLGSRHRFPRAVVRQRVINAGEVEIGAEITLEGLRREQHPIQHGKDIFAALGMQRQAAAELDQDPGNRVLKLPLRQDEGNFHAFTFLPQGIAPDQAATHHQPGPGMGGEILHRDALRLHRGLHRAIARQRQRKL